MFEWAFFLPPLRLHRGQRVELNPAIGDLGIVPNAVADLFVNLGDATDDWRMARSVTPILSPVSSAKDRTKEFSVENLRCADHRHAVFRDATPRTQSCAGQDVRHAQARSDRRGTGSRRDEGRGLRSARKLHGEFLKLLRKRFATYSRRG